MYLINIQVATVDIGFPGVTISHVNLSYRQYLYSSVLGYYRRYMAEIINNADKA